MPLQIFISHKMPSDTPVAAVLETELRTLSDRSIEVFQAGTIRYGANWQDTIQQKLDQTDWLVFLHTTADEDWGFCLFECGYFRHIMQSDNNKKLITFCRNESQVNGALREFKAVEISRARLIEFLEQACRDKPWYSNPNVKDKAIEESADRILHAFDAAGSKVTRHVATSFTIEMDLPNVPKNISTVPEEAIVSGIPGWEILFGKRGNGQWWKWGDLTEGFPFLRHYDFLFSRAMTRALNSDEPRPFLLRVNDISKTYRLSLHKYDEVGTKKLTFHIVAVPIDVSVGDANVMYNLVDLSWNFRKRIVDKVYQRVRQLKSMKEPDKETLKDCFEDLEEELIDISAEAISRGIDNPLVLQNALRNNPKSEALLVALEEWGTLQSSVFENIPKGKDGIDTIASSLHRMAALNRDMYKMAARGYWQEASKLRLPPGP